MKKLMPLVEYEFSPWGTLVKYEIHADFHCTHSTPFKTAGSVTLTSSL